MNSFFRTFRNVILSVAAVAAIAFTGLASAQVATSTCVSGCLPPTPTAPVMGITAGGWFLSGAVAAGNTNGTGQEVTGQVVTQTEEMFTLGTTTQLTRNDNPDCGVACNLTEQRQTLTGFTSAGAASVGFAGFVGSSCATGSCPTGASSLSQTGTNAMFNGSVFQQLQATPAPVAAQ